MTNQLTSSPMASEFEPLVTLKHAAETLGLPYFKVQRAVRAGIIPTYFVYNSRRLVRLSEVVEVINASREGGKNE